MSLLCNTYHYMYDAMIFKKLPHGTEVIFIKVIDGVETIYEDWFDHHDEKKIESEYIKKAY